MCTELSHHLEAYNGEIEIVEYVSLGRLLPYVEVEDGLRPLKLLGFSC